MRFDGFRASYSRQSLKYKIVHNVGDRTDEKTNILYNVSMAGMPNQIEGEHYGLLQQIARCRRLAKELHDQVTVERLLALAAEYEQKLNPPPSE
jgi:hypothetical protein